MTLAWLTLTAARDAIVPGFTGASEVALAFPVDLNHVPQILQTPHYVDVTFAKPLSASHVSPLSPEMTLFRARKSKCREAGARVSGSHLEECSLFLGDMEEQCVRPTRTTDPFSSGPCVRGCIPTSSTLHRRFFTGHEHRIYGGHESLTTPLKGVSS